ncbi:agl cluster protein AglQ [Haloferax larsenii]|uniref:Agl cluster protein AglQ n=1 Tax=Haloferax larsenii TaxID=302484 RepID=A0A1H7STR9_HALLR|nr:agl cluster protein AglQ [Haloferax larsenii]SEL75963.1 hypothetical protein SAMN04488691_107218 [Haloferax larsenii]
MTQLADVIAASADAATEFIDERGAMTAGHNGPYHDFETPVRNTAHWLVTFCYCYEVTGEERFRNAAEQLYSYLQTPEVRPESKTYECRRIQGKDRCNGLIGQAWAIEGLVAVAETLGDETAHELAAEIFLHHPYNEELSLWQRVEVDGKLLGLDRTFNHQLWFAAAGGLIANSDDAPEVDRQVRGFLDSLGRYLNTYDSGLIRHPLCSKVSLGTNVSYLTDTVKRGIVRNNVLHYLRPPSRKQALKNKAIGYHTFNLYGFSLLAAAYPDHSAWELNSISKALDFATGEVFERKVEQNDYSYPYNPPGFELTYALETFSRGTRDERRTWVERQLDHSFDGEKMLMVNGTEDEATHAARLYEATRLENYTLDDSALSS